MTYRSELQSSPAGGRISQGMSPIAERRAQQAQARQPQDGERIAYDKFGRQTIVPARGVQRLGVDYIEPDTDEVGKKLDELIDNLRDGGFLDEEASQSPSGTPGTGDNMWHAEDVGDGVTTLFTITHSLGTRDVHVTVYATAFPYTKQALGGAVWTACTHATIGTVTVTLAGPVGTDAYRVYVTRSLV